MSHPSLSHSLQSLRPLIIGKVVTLALILVLVALLVVPSVALASETAEKGDTNYFYAEKSEVTKTNDSVQKDSRSKEYESAIEALRKAALESAEVKAIDLKIDELIRQRNQLIKEKAIHANPELAQVIQDYHGRYMTKPANPDTK